MSEKIIAGRYRIQEQLGIGGMGTVYKGIDTSTGTIVAIKELKPELTSDDMLARFKREGEALKQLNHPNIVHMLDTVEHKGRHYLIMDYVAGGDLDDLLEHGELPLKDVLNFSIDLADALTRAHRLDIIHRDLKPANVLIADDSTLRLTDFGVAIVGRKKRVTEAGAVVGTLDYMPPEIFAGVPYDARGDIWAFGVMLCEMLTGKRPFSGNSVAELVKAITTDTIPDLEHSREDVPPALIDLIYRMLDKDPGQRIQSIRIVGAELEAILAGRDTGQVHPRFATPTPRKMTLSKHNLPHQSTEFVGRELEQTEVAQLLTRSQNRLVTLVAQGGTGKTRLSLKIAETLLDQFADGVYFIELAQLDDSAQIVPAISGAMQFQFQDDGRDHQTQLLDFLAEQDMLLVLDNYEHLMDGVTIVDALIKNTAVTVLATSRMRLALPGEVVYTLGGMPFPETGDITNPLSFASVQLFVRRAQRIRVDFEAEGEQLQAVAEICRMVYGMPLGIVLATSWLSMLDVQEIATELQAGLDMLEDEIGEFPDRQQSIRAVMDYSWQQMTDIERTIYMQLSVFRGGFSRQAAQNITGATMRQLMGLINKAFLRRDPDSGRYLVHELLRQYAAEHLEDSGTATPTRDAHASYFADYLAECVPLLKGKDQFEALKRIDSEQGNLLHAWKYAVSSNQPALIAKMVEPFYLYGFFRSWNKQIQEAFDYARTHWHVYTSDEPLHHQLIVRFPADNRDPIADLEAAQTIAESTGNALEVAFCTHQRGMILSHKLASFGSDNSTMGIKLLEESIEMYREQTELFYAAMALDDLAWAMAVGKRMFDRYEKLVETRDLRRQIGDKLGLARGASGLASAEPDYAVAVATLQEALDVARTIHDYHSVAWAHAMMAQYMLYNGQLQEAIQNGQQAIDIGTTLHMTDTILFATVMMLMSRLVLGDDPNEIKEEFDKNLSDDLDNPVAIPVVMYVTVHLLMLLHTRLSQHDQFHKALHTGLEWNFDRNITNWFAPNAAIWIVESEPETAFAYLEYALQHPEDGSRWITHSQLHMALYESLRKRYTPETAPALYQRVAELNKDRIEKELKDYVASVRRD